MRIETELRARTGTAGVLAAGVLWFLWEMVKEAVFGFLNTSLAELFGMSDFTIQQAHPLLATYGPPVVLMSSVMALVFWAYKLGGVEAPISKSPSLVDAVGQEDFSPAIKPELDPKPIKPIRRRIQTAAITEDNPKGSWEEITVEPDPVSASEPTSIFDEWDLVDIFTVGQAACLWCELRPESSYQYQKGKDSRIVAIEQMLVAEHKNGLLPLDSSNNALSFIGDYSSSFVSRADLKALAEKKGKKPKFLYLEER